MHRPAVAAVLAVALVAGGGSAWAWQAHQHAAADVSSRDRVASAVTAGADDQQAVADLADRSAGVVGQGLLASARDELDRRIAAAQAVLDGSAGKVADDAVRQQLAAAIGLVQATVAGTVAPAQTDDVASRLSSASAAVAAAQQAWETQQAQQAAAAARAATASPSPTPRATSPAPTATASCATTYHGPAFYTSVPATGGDGSNGNVPASAMTRLTWAGTDSMGNGYWLVTAAATALTRLNTAFQARFGHHLDIDLAYRDLATQRAMFDALGPKIAAEPGTSNHGTGTAFDVPEWPCEYGLHTAERDWLVTHGPAYGWHASTSEYWHYDYRP